MNRWFLLIGCVLCVASFLPHETPPEARQEYQVQVSGHFDCLNNGVPEALADAHVEIMDSDNDVGTFGDDLMGMTDTDTAGDFSGDGVGGDGGSWSWSRPDVYARVLLDDQWSANIRMKDDNDATESRATPQHDHDNAGDVVDVGSMWWGSQASTAEHNATAPCIWLQSRRAVLQYANLMHEPPPEGRYEIHYWAGIYPTPGVFPLTTLATTHWPRHYSMYGGRTNIHEFYHALRHGYDGDQMHFDWDDTRFRYGRYHEYCDSHHVGETQANREGFAFNEGWAEFADMSLRGTPRRCTPPAEAINLTIEGDVAFMLGLVERTLNSLMAAAGSPRQAREVMLSVLRDHPGSIHSFDEYCQAVQQVIPGSCGPAPVAAAVVRPADVAAEYHSAAARRMVQAEIAAQIDTTRGLNSALRAAQAAAAEVRTCTGEDCQAKVTTLVRPALIQREIQVHELVVRRLTAILADSAARDSSRSVFERRFNAGAADFQRQLLQLNLAALDQVVKSLAPLERRSPVARPLVDEWRRKIEVRRHGPVPASDQAWFYVIGEPSGMTARKGR